MFMRDVASKMGLEKGYMPTHTNNFLTQIIRRKNGKFDHKMSKSDPSGAILIHDTEKQLRKNAKTRILES